MRKLYHKELETGNYFSRPINFSSFHSANRHLKGSDGKSVGIDQVASTMHWGPYHQQNGWQRTHATRNLNTGTYGSGFHKYGLEWDENNIR
jgi:hypothetical protein